MPGVSVNEQAISFARLGCGQHIKHHPHCTDCSTHEAEELVKVDINNQERKDTAGFRCASQASSANPWLPELRTEKIKAFQQKSWKLPVFHKVSTITYRKRLCNVRNFKLQKQLGLQGYVFKLQTFLHLAGSSPTATIVANSEVQDPFTFPFPQTSSRPLSYLCNQVEALILRAHASHDGKLGLIQKLSLCGILRKGRSACRAQFTSSPLCEKR